MLYFHSFNIFCCTELTKVYIYKHLLWRKCSLPGDFLLRVGVITFFFNWITQLSQRNGERRRLRNSNTATGVTECGHQPAVILVKLMFCAGGVQHFLLRRTLYPVFHSQWSCMSFPSARLCGHNLVTMRCEFSETESRETPHVWEKL